MQIICSIRSVSSFKKMVLPTHTLHRVGADTGTLPYVLGGQWSLQAESEVPNNKSFHEKQN